MAPRTGAFFCCNCLQSTDIHQVLRQYELVERVKEYDPDADEALLNRAYVFSVNAHGSQKRASGDPDFSHPIEVAGILTDLHLDDETIATAILHDTIEDTLAMSDDISVLLVKLADRLHNMRTLHHIKNPDKRKRIARETMEIYAPLAERIGM